MIPSRRSGRSSCELVGVRPDARQRRLEVVADAAQEVVLGGVELEELGVLRLDLGEQLGVPDRDRDLAREQLEQVLVGALPRPGRRQVPDEHAELLVADLEDGPDRQRLAGDPLLDGRSSRGSTQEDVAVDHPERGAGVGGGAPGDELGAVAGRARSRSPARIRPSSRLRRSRSAARRLWLSARRASSSSPGTTIGVDRSPAEVRSTAAAIARERRR